MFASLKSSRIRCQHASSTASVATLYPGPSSRVVRPIVEGMWESTTPSAHFYQPTILADTSLAAGRQPFGRDLVENAVHDPRSHQDFPIWYRRRAVLGDRAVEGLDQALHAGLHVEVSFQEGSDIRFQVA